MHDGFQRTRAKVSICFRRSLAYMCTQFIMENRSELPHSSIPELEAFEAELEELVCL